MYKYELLRLLEDSDVQEKILKIVSEPEEKFPMYNADKISKLETEKDSALQRATTAERQLEILRGENMRLRNSLSQSEQRVKNLQREADNLQRDYQSELETAQKKISLLENSISELKWQNEQRFARGWELFQKYQRVGSHARQLLQGVFPHENFTSFICGGAQVNSLETLWDVLRECVMNHRQQDAEILWEVFEYCLELVNSSKAQASYSVLPVNVGERFDSDIHSEAPGSRAQGKISAVCLPGYRNDYSGKIIKKSIVQVS